MGKIVIACYRPKPGKADALLEEVRRHLPILRGEGLVTEREPIVMRAKDGTIVEVFEWLSDEAIQQAHENETVKAMWGRYEQCCDYTIINSLEEAGQLFATFEPIEI